MARVTLQQLGELVRRQRGSRGIREAAREVGVSSATLSRIERGNLPDLETFAKICRWLDIDPAEVLGVPTDRSAGTEGPGELVATAHFKAGQTTSPELAKALADLILAAQRMLQRQPS